ncbi:MAG: hypothetical protein RBS37_03315 [Bacteroidales bacterium]|jgi:hypothetical protein|nr:hypothetical protein [Bacteroidales bacterium]
MGYRLLILTLAALLASTAAQAQTYEETRTFRNEFPVTKDMTVDVINKYGTIEVTRGSGDSVRVRAEVIASSSNSQRLRKLLNGVSVNMTGTDYSIRIATGFTSNPGFLLEDFKSLTGKLITFENRLQVNYYISVPENINLKIDNRYGDVYLDDVPGRLFLSLSNGSLQAGNIDDADEIYLSFVNGSIGSIKSGTLNTSYSEVTLGGAQSLSLICRSSRLEIESLGTVKIDSRRDKIFIGTVDNISIESYFSVISVESVSDEIDLKSLYGSFTVPLLYRNFSSVSVDSQFTDIYMGLQKGVTAGIDVRSSGAMISLPESEKIRTEILNSEKNESVMSGTIGDNNSASRLRANLTKGSLTIFFNQ